MEVVFDTEPLLSFFLQEPGAAKIEDLIKQIEDGKGTGCLNIVNLMELRYVLDRAGRRQLASTIDQSMTSSGIKIIPLNYGQDAHIWKIAAELKAGFALSLGDACAAATALVLDRELLAGKDQEFKPLEDAGLLKIKRL